MLGKRKQERRKIKIEGKRKGWEGKGKGWGREREKISWGMQSMWLAHFFWPNTELMVKPDVCLGAVPSGESESNMYARYNGQEEIRAVLQPLSPAAGIFCSHHLLYF